ALADTAIATWEAKFAFQRPGPAVIERRLRPADPGAQALPAYPSEHAALAAAAAGVLEHLFPAAKALVLERAISFADAAQEAGKARPLAGTNRHSDLEAGTRLGQA